LAQILRQYERRGDAMRHLDNQGKVAWKSSPRFLTKLADAERDAEESWKIFRSGSGDRVEIPSNHALIE
jgi:hypothetical protein